MAHRFHEAVTPSGVPYRVRNLIGADQVTLTSAKNNRDNSGFNKLLSDCIMEIGDTNRPNENFVAAMVSQDRKDMLLQIRQHSLRFNPVFSFTYDWPARSGQAKELQEYDQPYDDTLFKRTPYRWVREAALAARPAGSADEQALAGTAPAELRPEEWPAMYQSYAEMLEAETRDLQYTLPESGAEVVWNVLTGKAEKGLLAIVEENRNSNTPLLMRQPRVWLQPTNPEASPIKTAWDVMKADILDVEGFRKHIREVEGNIDSIMTIQHQTDPTRVARVDLTSTVDFFFPSRAI